MKIKLLSLLSLLLCLSLVLVGCAIPGLGDDTEKDSSPTATTTAPAPEHAVSVDDIPPYSGSPYVIVNNNQPFFEEDDLTAEAYEFFSPLDALGRCGYVMASIGVELMPTEERGSIGAVKPSGWQTAKYDIVSGKYLYNRCHLIGFQLTGENANELNLITGTRYMNVDGMLPFEDMVAAYVKETENHVIYRVTPIYTENELVARGVLIEAYSVEDHGDPEDGICFNVYVYNVQPGIEINYATGESWLSGEPPITAAPTTTATPESDVTTPVKTYIVNTSSDKFHKEDCRYAEDIKPENRDTYVGTRDYLIEVGFEPCGSCKP